MKDAAFQMAEGGIIVGSKIPSRSWLLLGMVDLWVLTTLAKITDYVNK